MRNRNIKINVFLNEEEKKIFDEKVKKFSGIGGSFRHTLKRKFT